MSEPENFLQRWSKRKLAQSEPPAPETPQAKRSPQKGPAQASSVAGPDDTVPTVEGATEPLDLASLPPIDSIGPADAVSAFLRPGVPPDLTRAALRRAWSSDPAIRDFVGLVENGWDFNNPEAMGGFGELSVEEVTRLASNILAQLPELTAETSPPSAAPAVGKAALPEVESHRTDEPQPVDPAPLSSGNDAVQQKADK